SSQSPAVLAFWRSFVGLVVMAPIILRQGWSVMRISRPGLVLTRSLFGTAAFLCSMFAISDAFDLPLSQFNAISFARALFVTILAALFLREVVGPWRWGAVSVGFLGVLIMVLPGLFLPGYASEAIILDGGTVFALLSALGFAGAIVMVKSLSSAHSPITLLIWANLLSTLLLAPCLLFEFVMPTLGESGLIVAMALTGVAGQYFYINGMAVGDASFLAPIDYLRLPMAALADWVIFKLLPGAHVWLGAGVIVSATLFIAFRERRKKTPKDP
ncbi:MAG: DMT family transporter, partial [Pseudomonadota bacterium]